MLAAAVCAALAARGDRVAAFKPVVTGLDEPAGHWPRDHELLASAASAGQRPEGVTPAVFGPPASPHYAAELAATRLDPSRLLSAARATGAAADVLICEGVGGLFVPLTPDYLIRDLAVELALPLLIAARPGLGTINHTLLTVGAARSAGLVVAAVVLTPWPGEPSGIEISNRATIERLGDVSVATLPFTTPERLAAAGADLPVGDWF